VLAVNTASTSYQVGQVVGLGVVVALAVVVVRKAATTGFGGRQSGPLNRFAVVAAISVAAIYVVQAAGNGVFDAGTGPQQPWASAEGVSTKAGFIDGCGQNDARRKGICECVFARVASAAPYDTPARFVANLLPAVQRFAETQQVSALPTVYVSAARDCAARAAS
jgi:hypothetical protein